MLNSEDFNSPTLKRLEADGTLRTELHPTTQTLIKQMARYGGLSNRISVPFARRQMQKMMPLVAAKPSVASVIDRTVSGTAGSVPIRVVTPHTGRDVRPAIVWFPGGGFVLGDLETAEPTARSLANRLGAIVVCVDYRKAPEHLVDEAYDDGMSTVRWVFSNAADLGIDATRICVGGDSAGGNIAAVVAQEWTVEHPDQPLAAQALIYPSTSGENEPARLRNIESGTLNESSMRWFELHVAGTMDPDSARYSPLATPDLRGLPPAVIVTAGWDPLRDEAIVYFDRLRDADVRAEHLHYSDDVHGFLTMDLVLDNGPVALDAVADLLGDMLELEEADRSITELSPLEQLRSDFDLRTRRTKTAARYALERMTHAQIKSQRWLIRNCGLPSGRDVEGLSSQVKRLENQVRTLRRQLDRQDAASSEELTDSGSA
ncbi:MAG: alpha/beta hydrolase [Jatrophihabitans sp.]